MSDQQVLQELLRLSQAAYDQQRQALIRLQQEENRIREDLRRLDSLKNGLSTSGDSIPDMRMIGADLLWQGWRTRSKVQLNMQLARQLALKGQEQAKVRKAFGRVQAVRQLLETESAERKARDSARSLQIAIDQSLFGNQ